MNDNAVKWVEALESGKYEQGFKTLNDNGKFCCLGVACDLYLKEHKLDWKYDKVDDKYYIENSSVKNILPSFVRDWLGLKNNSGNLKKTCLWEINDSKEKNFSEIAQIIKDNESELFKE